MKTLVLLAVVAVAGIGSAFAQEGMRPEMSEFYDPKPPVVVPGVELAGGGFTAPSDYLV
jgi:opacity protein-like surface antigen